MSYEIRLNIPEDSRQGRLIAALAAQLRISLNEAAERIISEAAGAMSPAKKAIPGLPGDPLSDEEVAMMDEIVGNAMEARRQRLERYSRA